MAASYAQINAIADPALRQLVQLLFDQNAALTQRVLALETNALQRGSPVPANARIINLEDALTTTDAVNVRTMQRYVQAQLGAQAQRTAAAAASAVDNGASIPGNPNTTPSDAVALYDGSAIVQGVFAANPGMVATSCQRDVGGTWDLMDAIVDALRAADPRFGYNGKRGNTSDPSLDAVAYDYAATPGGEGSTTVYVVDVIAGHCGGNPQPGWNDVTVFGPGAWTGRGRF